MLMKVKCYLFIFLILFCKAISFGQELVKEYRSCIPVVDNFWILEIYTNHTYRYLNWSSFYGTTIIDSGNYIVRRNTLKLQSRLATPSDHIIVPAEVRYKKKLSMSCDSAHFLQRRSFFGKEYLEVWKE